MRNVILSPMYNDLDPQVLGRSMKEVQDWFWEDISNKVCDSKKYKNQMDDDFIPYADTELKKVYDALYACKDLNEVEAFMGKYLGKFGSDMWGRLNESR